MGVGGNSALSKNSADGILNLLQLSLLGNNAGVNVNAAPPTSNITNLSGSCVPNSNNVMTAAKANFYPQSVGATLGALSVNSLTGVLAQQPIISQAVSQFALIIHNRFEQTNLTAFFLLLSIRNHAATEPNTVANKNRSTNRKYCQFGRKQRPTTPGKYRNGKITH